MAYFSDNFCECHVHIKFRQFRNGNSRCNTTKFTLLPYFLKNHSQNTFIILKIVLLCYILDVAPSRVRGLKFGYQGRYDELRVVAPSRVRGLK